MIYISATWTSLVPPALDLFFNLAVDEEIERPAGGIADEIWRQAAVECGEAAFVVGDLPDDAEGAAESGGGGSVD